MPSGGGSPAPDPVPVGTGTSGSTGIYGDATRAAVYQTHSMATVSAVAGGLSFKQGKITTGTAAPSGGNDGDIYLQYT